MSSKTILLLVACLVPRGAVALSARGARRPLSGTASGTGHTVVSVPPQNAATATSFVPRGAVARSVTTRRPRNAPGAVALSATTRRPQNAPGLLYVDERCINCQTCRWMAPETFTLEEGKSAVTKQPDTPAALAEALMAAPACPTGSIRVDKARAKESPLDVDQAAARDAFPAEVSHDVYHLGFHSPKSFGATSWLVRQGDLNIVVDAPRYNSKLGAAVERLCGGAPDLMLLTHMDDVADHNEWKARWPSMTRVMHAADIHGPDHWPHVDMRSVELQISADATLAPGVEAISTPGHSRGSLCFLVGDNLFTGDHLAYVAHLGRLDGFPRTGWDLQLQSDSMRKLKAYEWSTLYPGHGRWKAFAERAQRDAAIDECAATFAEGQAQTHKEHKD
mmetsp:Transcript_26357/g.82061  ORF Transcript_26357/g.82061 Transcript_26357/m.82061 type:complete len:392 (-) Transcript_26357:127-1302(-)